MNEIWKKIVGYEDYEISNYGRIKSFKKNQEKILSPSKDKDGYKQIILHNNDGIKRFYVHRLVAIHFIPNPNNYKIVNHKDETKDNNVVDNLEWCNTKYNINWGTRNNRMIETRKKNKGLTAPKSIVQTSINGEKIKEWNSACECARELNITQQGISACCLGKIESFKGFIWRFNNNNINT